MASTTQPTMVPNGFTARPVVEITHADLMYYAAQIERYGTQYTSIEELQMLGQRITQLREALLDRYNELFDADMPAAPAAAKPVEPVAPAPKPAPEGWEYREDGHLYRKPVAAPKPEPVAAPAESSFTGVHDGYYTVVTGDEYRTLRIKTQKPDANFKPGVQIASVLNGPDNWSNYQSFAELGANGQFKVWQKYAGAAHLVRALAILCGSKDAQLAGLKGYAMQSGKCGICGRMLTTPESIARGIGPECASKL